jgi:hypothetical protein
MSAARNLQAPTSWAAIMLGCRCLGHIVSRGVCGVEAYDANDKSIGTFPTQAAAADALGRLLLEEAPQ